MNSFIRINNIYQSHLSNFEEPPLNKGKIMHIFNHFKDLESHIENKLTDNYFNNEFKSFLQEDYYQQLFDFFSLIPQLADVYSSKIYSVLLEKFENRINKSHSIKFVLFS